MMSATILMTDAQVWLPWGRSLRAILSERATIRTAASISTNPAGLTLDASTEPENTFFNPSTSRPPPFDAKMPSCGIRNHKKEARNKPQGRVYSAVPPHSPGKPGLCARSGAHPARLLRSPRRLRSDLRSPPFRAASQPVNRSLLGRAEVTPLRHRQHQYSIFCPSRQSGPQNLNISQTGCGDRCCGASFRRPPDTRFPASGRAPPP